MREFVDTNILVYAADRSEDAKHRVAAQLVERLWTEGTGCVSIQVLQELHTTLTRKAPRAATIAEALSRIAIYRAWPVFAPQLEDVTEAIALQLRWRVSFWDAMIVHAGLQLGCDILWSEGLQPGQRFEAMQVRSPF